MHSVMLDRSFRHFTVAMYRCSACSNQGTWYTVRAHEPRITTLILIPLWVIHCINTLFLTTDICAVPSRWGHTTINLTPTVGIAIGFRTKDVEAAKLVVDAPRSCATAQQVDKDRVFADLRAYAGSSAQNREL